MQKWNRIYKQYKTYGAPLDHISELGKMFKERRVKNILDLGCGSAKHIAYLAKQEFSLYGIDISEEAIKIGRKMLKENKLKADLKVGSMHEKLPYKSGFFDAVISFRVLNHGEIGQVEKTIKEIERVLKPSGIIFITVQKVYVPPKDANIKRINGIQIRMTNAQVYTPLEGPEKGIVHFIFNKKILRKKFKKFKIKKLWIDYGKEKWQRYYCLFGELKIRP